MGFVFKLKKSQNQKAILPFLLLLSLCRSVDSYDLKQAKVKKLENGLTVMVLEDHAQPLVSTQVLYKVGARNECTGSTGLAHFVEHMAFRATKNFPDTQDAIYSVGGEWHGYTWIDQTTYFETVPVQHLDTVLRLQADRMVHVVNREQEVEAERGAVLTELHSYENDPGTVLFDKVIAISFLEHPYRFNTIGWTSDVEKITHLDLVEFYERYYNPANAVLAISGAVKTEAVLDSVEKYFGPLAARKINSLPRTVEPPQKGERRINLRGPGKLHHFQITYRAPAAKDADYPAFLLMQAILAGSHGVSFRQSGFGVRVPEGARLAGIGKRINTFFMATAQPYVFNITGNTDAQPQDVEKEIEERITSIRENEVTAEELNAARGQLLSELVFDVETTEDAAHQMAFFEGIDAFSVLQNLSGLLQQVNAADVRRVAQKYLLPEKRTIGWFLGDGATSAQITSRASVAAFKDSPATIGAARTSIGEPLVKKITNGPALIVKNISRTPTAFLRLLIPSNTVETTADSSGNDPVWAHTSIHWRFLKEDLESTIEKARKALNEIRAGKQPDAAEIDDPEARLIHELQNLIGGTPPAALLSPRVISVVGDVDPASTMAKLEKAFRDFKKPHAPGQSASGSRPQGKSKTIRLTGKAQSQFGYAVAAPAPSSVESYAYRVLLYIMTHGYGGRLGKELIHKRGMIYYISSDYHSDGEASWISIRYGVNPDKLNSSKELFEKLMQNLTQNPPAESELAEAKRHLIGRRITAHQSNEELSAFYVREFVEHGKIPDQSEFERRMNGVTLAEVERIIPQFIAGSQVLIDTSP